MVSKHCRNASPVMKNVPILILLMNIWMWSPLCFGADSQRTVANVFAKVRSHDFHPLNQGHSFTSDRSLGKHGIANLNNLDGRVRMLAMRDLVRQLPKEAESVFAGLSDDNVHVRQIAAAVLGIAKQTSAVEQLEKLLREDSSPLVRSQAAMSLGQLASKNSIELLNDRQKSDPSRDVQHQCELAIDQISKQRGATAEQLKAFHNLNPEQFETVQVGEPAPDFTLLNSDSLPWQLSTANEGNWVVLIWVFADWCPVCHGEFRELVAMRSDFETSNVQVATIECHDTYRCRVMVGKETDPKYWFSKKSFQESYRKGIWWPHLSDPAGAIGAMYGVDPMSFVVHAEYINRPSTIIIDPQGIVRYAYFGTFWGDRPSIHQTLEMIKQQKFEFSHPQRLRMTSE
jgi:peroxiredoxin